MPDPFADILAEWGPPTHSTIQEATPMRDTQIIAAAKAAQSKRERQLVEAIAAHPLGGTILEAVGISSPTRRPLTEASTEELLGGLDTIASSRRRLPPGSPAAQRAQLEAIAAIRPNLIEQAAPLARANRLLEAEVAVGSKPVSEMSDDQLYAALARIQG